MQPLLTIKAAAEILQIKPQTLRLWVCKGKIKAYKVGGIKFKMTDLEAYTNKQVIKTPKSCQEILDSM